MLVNGSTWLNRFSQKYDNGRIFRRNSVAATKILLPIEFAVYRSSNALFDNPVPFKSRLEGPIS